MRNLLRLPENIAAIAKMAGAGRKDYAVTPEDMAKALGASALARSVAIVEAEMPAAVIFQEVTDFYAYCLGKVSPHGACCEFGVYSGDSINSFADLMPGRIFDGFDSFRGLPEPWGGHAPQDFNRGGSPPVVRVNVRLHVGTFEQTLPAFVASIKGVAFLHVDCDLYASTACIFSQIGHQLNPGCVVIFDEYFGYPGFEFHERKAFAEFLTSSGRRAEWFACCGQRAACIIC